MKSKKLSKSLPIKTLADQITEKMNVLCAISKINRDVLFMSIPGGLSGVLSISNISRWLSEDEYLADMFKIGTALPCQVLHIQRDEMKISKIILSADPCLINETLCNKDFYQGMILHAAVKSREEYGYEIDVGIPSVHAFLKDNEAENCAQFRIGQLIKCVVTDIKSDCIQVTCNPEFSSKVVFPERSLAIRELTPGLRTTVTVSRILNTGLEVDFFNFVSVVHKSHLENQWNVPHDYTVGSQLNATVLYVEPVNKVVYLNLNSRLYETGVCSLDCSIGDVFQKAVIVEEKPNSVYLRISNKLRALCSRKRFPSDTSSLQINSKHRCCVVGLDLMDSLIFVSMKESNWSTLKYSDINIGDILKGKVTQITGSGYKVTISPTVTGFIPQHQVTDNVNKVVKLKLNYEIKCRVLKINPEDDNLILSSKKSIVSYTGPILANYDDAKVGMVVSGVISELKESRIRIKFFNNISGIIGYKSLMENKISDAESKFHLGETLSCRIIASTPEKEIIQLCLHDPKEVIEIGKIYSTCYVVRLKHDKIEVKLDGKIPACILISHLSDAPSHCILLNSTINVGDDIGPVFGFSNTAVNFVTKKQSFLNSILTKGETDSLLKNKAIVPCVFRKALPSGIVFRLAGNMTGIAKLSNTFSYPEGFKFLENMSFICKILKFNLKGVIVSARLEDVWDGKESAAIDWLKNYLREKREIEKLLIKSKDEVISFLAKSMNQIVKFHVTKATSHNISGYFHKQLQIAASALNITDVKAGKCVKALVINVDLISKRADLAMLPSTTNSKVKTGYTTDAKVILVTNEFAVVTLLDGSDSLAYLPIKNHFNDLVSDKSKYALGEVYSVKIVNTEIFNGTIALVNKHSSVENTFKRKSKEEDSFNIKLTKKQKKELDEENENTLKRKSDEINEKPKRKKLKKAISSENNDEFDHNDSSEEKCLDVGNKFEWNNSWDAFNGQENHVDEDDTDTFDENDTGAKQKKKTKAEEEELIYVKERALADESRLPETDDEYERLVLASPNSSLVWLQYACFHLQNVQVEKARAVCKRALSTISFREEQERLNVWTALINLENTYGTDDSLNQTIKDAEKNNDLLKLSKHVVEMFQNDNKIERAIDIFTSLIKRYRKDERIWIEYLTFLMEQQRFDEARNTLATCVGHLTSKQIVDLTSKMGQMEFKIGDKERGRTIFENLITNHPKRTDLWSVFIDLEIKAGNIDGTRNLLERAISLKGSSRQMKTFFKKYLEFEKNYGDVENLNHVKRKAEEYVNSQ